MNQRQSLNVAMAESKERIIVLPMDGSYHSEFAFQCKFLDIYIIIGLPCILQILYLITVYKLSFYAMMSAFYSHEENT